MSMSYGHGIKPVTAAALERHQQQQQHINFAHTLGFLDHLLYLAMSFLGSYKTRAIFAAACVAATAFAQSYDELYRPQYHFTPAKN